ncbi:hypothetical protein DNX69_12015 [Rhodopseudomonas palustris]|uniref:Uncharacterized protein n=1 Tax=Rhodopseudomonas palustris TaxID=1076 RepID=A0A323UIL6_RHOPL|nr:hypothetical protein [Rhodopseudomonas palustris]PZA11903.1 hypothetical protein DNX69_12015 [Rhodopseudomonas palustris]
MPYRAFLARIRQFFDGPDEHLDLIASGLAGGELRQPATPMTDQELAEAIREFQKAPPSEDSLKKLGAKLTRRQ